MIAVITDSLTAYNGFIRNVHPRDRHTFKRASSVDQTRGLRFDDVVRLYDYNEEVYAHATQRLHRSES